MPTYDYECKSCGASFEIFQSMSDEPVSVCPDCGGAVRRLIGGGAGIIFKGSGFYVTDNKRKAASSTSSPSAGGSAEKPAPKKEPAVSTSKES
jgi:putative FmdB family regulatory protein